MLRKHGLLLDKTFVLLAVVIVLQAVALVLMVSYGANILDKNRTIEKRTHTMMTEIFPSLANDLGDVSQKASEIKKDVVGLRHQVSTIDGHVNEANQGVAAVGRQVAGLDRNVRGFVENKSGLIWGHSLNPYVLIALLAIIAAGVPLCSWYFFKNRQQISIAVEDHHLSRGFAEKLDKLTHMVEKIRFGSGRFSENLELQELMDKTERLIDEARMELIFLSGKEKPFPQESDGPDILH
jgi:hypothetical protein